MISKHELREKLIDFLDFNVPELVTESEELADSFVEQLDEDGAFDLEQED